MCARENIGHAQGASPACSPFFASVAPPDVVGKRQLSPLLQTARALPSSFAVVIHCSLANDTLPRHARTAQRWSTIACVQCARPLLRSKGVAARFATLWVLSSAGT